MKEIYVYKQMFGGWKGIPKEEAEAKIKDGYVYGVKLKGDCGDEHEPVEITLLKDHFGIFAPSDAEMNQLANEYLTYVEEITGMVSKPNT